MMKKDVEKKLDEMEQKVKEMKSVIGQMASKKSELEKPRGLFGNLKHLFVRMYNR